MKLAFKWNLVYRDVISIWLFNAAAYEDLTASRTAELLVSIVSHRESEQLKMTKSLESEQT